MTGLELSERLLQLFALYYEGGEGEAIIASIYTGNDLQKAIEAIQGQFYRCPPAVRTKEQFLRWLRELAKEYDYDTRNGYHAGTRAASVYFDAATYASGVLGAEAVTRFPEIHRLAKSGLSLEQIQQEIRHWSGTPALPPNPDAIAVGGKYGKSTRTRHVRGLMWKLECPYGHAYEQSTNEFVAIEARCPVCERSTVVTDEQQKTQANVGVWFKAHDQLIWMKVYKALRNHNIIYGYDDPFAKELHAHIWAHIVAQADHYQDQGYKVTAWLGTVADNCLQDFFKVQYRRNELAPTTAVLNEDGTERTDLPVQTDWGLVSEPKLSHSTKAGVTQARGPLGASPKDDANNAPYEGWDVAQM